MVTKFTTGDAVMIPAKIRTAKEKNGQIFYDVDAETWEVPENAVSAGEKADALAAFARELERMQW